MDLTILLILIAKYCFLTIFSVSIRIWKKERKIWKFKMTAASDVIFMVVADMETN